ncbi:MAG: prohibitin family protein, partial [Bacteroidota bacterium]
MLFIIAILIIAVALISYFNLKKNGRIQEAKFATIGIAAGFIIAFLQMFTIVPAGTVGVVDFLGMVSDNTLKSGVNFVNPMAKVIDFTIKTQELKEM